MHSPDPAPVRTVVVLKADRIYAECVRQLALRVFPAARVEIATSVKAVTPLLAKGSVDLFVTGIGVSIDGDVLELLASYLRPPRTGTRRVLVMSAGRDYRELAALRALGIDGVFDSALEPTDGLMRAMKIVATGGRYWSLTIAEAMDKAGIQFGLLRVLTTFEQLALSIIGDGSDDVVAARVLGVSPGTVSSVRRDIHRKLGVQHRGELVRIAAQYGFVRFLPDQVLRPGYSILSAAYHARKAQRHESPSHATRIAAAARHRHVVQPTSVMAAVA